MAEMSLMKKFWDHSTEPSTYVVVIDGKEEFRGGYDQGMMFIKSLKNDGMISFEEDFMPYASTLCKRYYRALMCERELRREIIKLKKEIKELKGCVRRKIRNDLTKE